MGIEINDKIAKLFRQYAILIQQDGETNKFKINSYNKAALLIERMGQPVTMENVHHIRGVGSSLSSKIEEILETGDFSQRAELASQHEDIMTLVEIPNIGAKRIPFQEDSGPYSVYAFYFSHHRYHSRVQADAIYAE